MTLCSVLDTKKESAAEKLGKWLLVVVSAVFAVVELTFLSRITRAGFFKLLALKFETSSFSSKGWTWLDSKLGN